MGRSVTVGEVESVTAHEVINIIGIVNAISGKAKELPVIGKIKIFK